jgi:N-acetylglucosamine malate deacetylase 1
MSVVLVISVHPDDETLGCGGTILKHVAEGDEVFCAHVTVGNKDQGKLIEKIKNEYGFVNSFSLGFIENTIDDISLNDLISEFTKIIQQVKPQVMYVPNRSDIHSDHRRVFEALSSCMKSFRFPFIRKILMCEVLSETDFAPALIENVFIPNVYVDISKYFKRKKQILDLFKTEILPSPFTRSFRAIEAHNIYRGSQINAYYAESFMLLKEII